jgi:hypothetical protein
MTKYLFDHRVTPGAELPLTVPLFDICSPSHRFREGSGRVSNDWVEHLPSAAMPVKMSHFLQSVVLRVWEAAIPRIMTSNPQT